MQVLSAVFFGLDLQELQTFRERVNAVTVDDIQRVARTYLHPDRLSIVLVGDASKFEKQLAGAGFDQFEKISVSDLDLSSPTLRRQRTGAGRILPAGFQAAKSAGTGAVATDEAKALIDRAVRAKGGLERLKTDSHRAGRQRHGDRECRAGRSRSRPRFACGIPERFASTATCRPDA